MYICINTVVDTLSVDTFQSSQTRLCVIFRAERLTNFVSRKLGRSVGNVVVMIGFCCFKRVGAIFRISRNGSDYLNRLEYMFDYPRRCHVQLRRAGQKISADGQSVWRREDGGRARLDICHSRLSAFAVLCLGRDRRRLG